MEVLNDTVRIPTRLCVLGEQMLFRTVKVEQEPSVFLFSPLIPLFLSLLLFPFSLSFLPLPPSPSFSLKLFFVLFVYECLHLCMCIACMQCMYRPEEGIISLRTGVTDTVSCLMGEGS